MSFLFEGGPAHRANLKKGDIILSVAGQDVTSMSLKEVTEIIRSNTSTAIWLSICDAEVDQPLYTSRPHKMSSYASTPAINRSEEILSSRKFTELYKPNGNPMLSSYGNLKGNFPSPLTQNRAIGQTDSTYVTFVPTSSFITTRMSSLLLYCGPVKIPESWSNRGISSLCIQECARQLLGKKKPEDFVKVQLEVSQNSLRITNTSGNVLAKHHRYELYYCGLCSSDEQMFAVVTKSDSPMSTQAELCHVFKLLPESKLSTYCIDKSKSLKEVRSGQPVALKSCVTITETIQNIFQSDSAPIGSTLKRGDTDGVAYGEVKGISTFYMAPLSNSGVTSSLGQSSPLLKRKKSNVIDLRSVKSTVPLMIPGSKQRSLPNSSTPPSRRRLTPTNSAGHIGQGSGVHVRMHSDGIVDLSSSTNMKTFLRPHTPQDIAKRVSDSSLSSVSSDHSSHSHSSPSPSKLSSGIHTPVQEPQIQPTPQRIQYHRKLSGQGMPAMNTKQQLKRQVSLKYMKKVLYNV
jgi:hypothetical protein